MTAVIGQDPRIGGGFRSFATAFWEAAVALGHEPRLYYLSRGHQLSLVRRSVAVRPRLERYTPLEGTAFPSVLPEFDALNQVVGGLRIARRTRLERSVWVVATTAPYGFAAVCSRRPYACWLATGLESEWAARRRGLRFSRKVALVLNAPFLRALERLVIRRATFVYAISPASRRTIAAAGGIPLERVSVLPIPVDFEEFAPEPDEVWRRRLREPVVVFIGRSNDPRKNFRLLAEAFRTIQVRVPAARLRLIGEIPLGKLRRMLGSSTEIVGLAPSVAEPLRTSTLLVLPSRQEGFGIVVAEALTCGVPAVVTPCGGPEELVRNSGGGRVLSGFGADELVETVCELLARPDTLMEMRRRGREYVAREHSPARFRELVAQAFEELDAGG